MACFSEPVSGMERQDDSSVKKIFFFLLLSDKYPLKVSSGSGILSGDICYYRPAFIRAWNRADSL